MSLQDENFEEIKDLQRRVAELEKTTKTLRGERDKLRDALAFYADPATYFAIMLLPDPPAGAFIEDISDTDLLGPKPGKLARQVLGEDE